MLVAVERNRDLVPQAAHEVGGTAGVIEVAVGVEDHGRLQPRSLDPLDDPRRLLTGVDDRQHTGFAIAEQHAVRLNGSHWKYVEEEINHRKFSILNSQF